MALLSLGGWGEERWQKLTCQPFCPLPPLADFCIKTSDCEFEHEWEEAKKLMAEEDDFCRNRTTSMPITAWCGSALLLPTFLPCIYLGKEGRMVCHPAVPYLGEWSKNTFTQENAWGMDWLPKGTAGWGCVFFEDHLCDPQPYPHPQIVLNAFSQLSMCVGFFSSFFAIIGVSLRVGREGTFWLAGSSSCFFKWLLLWGWSLKHLNV